LFIYLIVDLYLFEQDFPILCQTCLGENPYIRMVSRVRAVSCVNY